MGSQQPSYDHIAEHYDFLSRLVFFKSQVRAQTEQLSYLKGCENLLIVGGGTGWILKDLNILPQKINIAFVETSVKMIDLAKKMDTHHPIRFFHQDIEIFETNIIFDAVLTPFVFDNFNNSKAENVFKHLDKVLASKAFWLYIDFRLDGTWWKKLLLKSMQLFLSLIKVVKVSTLPEMKSHFADKGYDLIREKQYYGGFIEAKVYQKQ